MFNDDLRKAIDGNSLGKQPRGIRCRLKSPHASRRPDGLRHGQRVESRIPIRIRIRIRIRRGEHSGDRLSCNHGSDLEPV